MLKWLVDVIGDRYVIMTSFALGMVSNFLYGMADCKSTIFVSAAVAAFVHMAFPAISAIKANNVVCICVSCFAVSKLYHKIYISIIIYVYFHC